MAPMIYSAVLTVCCSLFHSVWWPFQRELLQGVHLLLGLFDDCVTIKCLFFKQTEYTNIN